MLKSIKSLATATIALGILGLAGCATPPTKVVYHVNDSAEAVNAMRNANNHLDADPTAKITFVTHSKGVDFLLEGGADKEGNPYNIPVEKLMSRGVTFDVCSNTLVKRKIDAKTVLPGSKIVPSGVAEVATLQAKHGYVYIKP